MSQKSQEIFFTKAIKSNGYMNYLYPAKFEEICYESGEKRTYCCALHHFMYHKVRILDPTNKILLQVILEENDPKMIRTFGRQIRNYDGKKWSTHRYEVMLRGLRLQFTQNNDLKKQLVNTGNSMIYFASIIDGVWSIGYERDEAHVINRKKYGENLLGKALMQLRSELI